MFWVLMGLICALATSFSDVTNKFILKKDSPYFTGWLQLFLLIPFFLPILFFYKVNWLPWEFWGVIAMILPFEFFSFFLYLRALQISPLSLTVPFLSFTPILTLLFSLVILKEIPSLNGLLGVCLVTLGAYTLNLSALPKSIWGPILAIRREKGSFYMFIVALIFGLTSTLAKRALQLSNPFIFPAVYMPIFALAVSFYVYFFKRGGELEPSQPIQWRYYLLLLLLTLISIFSFNLGLDQTKAAYLISLKRLSLILGVAFGKYFFAETHIRERLTGALLMFLGVVLIIWN